MIAALTNLQRKAVRNILRDGTLLAGVQVSEIGMVAGRTLMLGALGERQLAAGALVQGIYTAVALTAAGVLQAVPAMAAMNLGAERAREQLAVLVNGIAIAIVLSIVGSAILLSMPMLFRWTSQPKEVVLEASSYVGAIWPALAAGLIAATLYGYGTALGRGKRLLAISTGVTLSSIPLTGFLALPWGLDLGVEGVGYAAVISSATLALCFGLAMRDNFPDFRSVPRASATFAGKMMKLGLPFGLIFLSEMSFLYVVTLLMGTMGEDELAAHAVVIQWVTLLLVFPVGFSQAAAVLVSRAVGQRDVDAVGCTGWTAAVAISVILTVQAFCMFLFPLEMAGIFMSASSSPHVAGLVSDYMRLAALAQFANGVVIVLAGALRGLQEVRGPLVGAIFVYWGAGLPAATVLAFGLDLGGHGLWIGMNVGFVLAAAILLRKFAQYPELFHRLSVRGEVR
ncbi:MAG: hypothetical protein KJ947_11150 [Alphaproteobacteria bacterium]|jgi:multidrug resistance protein, MATE family|nr:hypothetical protein [Alphaproteobacteria bacterium]MBU1550113.1 hypothetical protein [Alphaproteobacteria bacterium]MBU2337085.1 hypothetical protein [Alphaproteobacteria bacterium]MBU2389416.1 hypothetical protein [Alphaproteobacteria bacterium]